MLLNCKPGLPGCGGWGEQPTKMTGVASDIRSRPTGVISPVQLTYCAACVMCRWLRKWHRIAVSIASRPPTLSGNRAPVCSAVCRCTESSSVEQKQSLPSLCPYLLVSNSAGRPLQVPLCCLYRFSRCEVSGGYTKSCGLSVFFFYLPFLNCLLLWIKYIY